MLNNLQMPGAFSNSNKPIILPVGPLSEDRFAPIEGDGIDPETCPWLAAINFDCRSGVLPRFDLTKEYS